MAKFNCDAPVSTLSHRCIRNFLYELTAPKCVDLIVTDIAVIEVTAGGLVLKEVAPGWTPKEVQRLTGPRLKVAPGLL